MKEIKPWVETVSYTHLARDNFLAEANTAAAAYAFSAFFTLAVSNWIASSKNLSLIHISPVSQSTAYRRPQKYPLPAKHEW